MSNVLTVTAQTALVIDLSKLALQKYFKSRKVRFIEYEVRTSELSALSRWMGLKGRIVGVRKQKLPSIGGERLYVDVEFLRDTVDSPWSPYVIRIFDMYRMAAVATFYATKEQYEARLLDPRSTEKILGDMGYDCPSDQHGYLRELPEMTLLPKRT